ncbi:hypothetical protein BN1708_014797 [Verticillium longisporum]|nr:hypothetical protein BN1708_014797 [Verticillium longisporum]
MTKSSALKLPQPGAPGPCPLTHGPIFPVLP